MLNMTDEEILEKAKAEEEKVKAKKEKAKREHQRADAVKSIRSNGGTVNEKTKRVHIPKDSGIGVWGSFDCLVNHWDFKRDVREEPARTEQEPTAEAIAMVSAFVKKEARRRKESQDVRD